MTDTSTTAVRWQTAAKWDAHKAVFNTARYVDDQQRLQRLNFCIYEELYYGGNASGLGRDLSDIGTYWSGSVGGLRGARFNMVAAGVDTAHSLIGGSPPIPIYITSGTDLSVVRKADKKSKVLQSQMNSIGETPAREAFHTACRLGTGIVYGYLDEDGKAAIETVHPLELLIEHQDGYYRTPSAIHRRKYMSKTHLSAMRQYQKYRHEIETAAGPTWTDYATRFLLTGVRDSSEMIEVIESWYLGVGQTRSGAPRPGRHTICISNCTLLDEDFDEQEFPFRAVRYRNRPFGFFGAGLVESGREAQNRINLCIKRVAKGQDLNSNVIIFNPNGEGSIDPQWLSNEIGMVFNYEHSVGVPTLQKWNGTMEDLQQQIDLEFQRWLRSEGLSESQATGNGAGAGLSSGVAVRAQDDVMSRRLVNPTQMFSDFCVDIARLIEQLNDRAALADQGYVAGGYLAAGGKRFLRSSRWADLEIPDGEAQLNMMAMSQMPTTPAGKWASVSEWLQAGFVDKTSAMQLLEFPALDAWSALQTAQADLCRFQIEQILDLQEGDEPILPSERQDLQSCITTVTMAWAQAQMMSPSDVVLDGFDQYLSYAQQLLDEAKQSQSAQANQNPAAQAAPMGGIAAAPIAAPAQAA